MEEAQGVAHTLIVDRRGDVVGDGLHHVDGVAHGHSNARFLNDGNVVSAIAKGHGVGHIEALVLTHGHHSLALVGIAVGDVGEGGMPA